MGYGHREDLDGTLAVEIAPFEHAGWIKDLTVKNET